jgi:PhnB protein
MTSINLYLNFNGNAEQAFNFYKSVFGGEFAMVQRFGDIPSEHTLPDDDAQKILHIALPIGPHSILMGSDVPGTIPAVKIGNNFAISITAGNSEETTRIFNSLSSGGHIDMPLEKTFWSPLFGMLTDQFGIQWMVSIDEQS